MAREPEQTPQPARPTRPELWRGLEEWTDSPAFREMLHREFPDNATEWTDPVTRRHFLTLAGAGLALAGVAGCSPRAAPASKIYPYVTQPEQITLGNALYFASAVPLHGVGMGVLVKSREGRPVKIEGNPDHPASRGSTDIHAQAAILGLYDPDRSGQAINRGIAAAWEDALAALRSCLDRARHGESLRVLTETISSPTLAAQINDLLNGMPDARWVQYEPAGYDAARVGTKQAFGDFVNVIYDFTKADVVLSLDSDFLTCGQGGGHVRYSRDYSDRRRIRGAKVNAEPGMNRLYVVESELTNTGGSADHRLPIKSMDIEAFARALATRLKVAGAAAGAELSALAQTWIEPLAADLEAHKGRCVVVAGDGQPVAVHALAHAINSALGNFGQTVLFTNPVEAKPSDQTADLQALAKEMADGKVKNLLLIGGNPVYNAPVDLKFTEALTKVPFRFHLGLYADETAVRCDWHVPEAHFLETWGDVRAFDGTVTVMQPLIAPLFDGRSAIEVLATATDRPETNSRDIVQAYWKKNLPQGAGTDFETYWQHSVQSGLLKGTKFPTRSDVKLQANWAGSTSAPTAKQEIVFKPDPTLIDGSFANNPWLQELPKPVSKLTWDNAALMGPKLAEELRINYQFGLYGGGEHGRVETDMVELTHQGRKLTAAVWVMPGHADDSVTIYLGSGRERAGQVGTGTGFNAYKLRTSTAPHFGELKGIRKTGERYVLASTQVHFSMEDRKPVRRSGLEKFRQVLGSPDQNYYKNPPTSPTETDLIYSLVPSPSNTERTPEQQEQDRRPSEAARQERQASEQDRRLKPLSFYPGTSKAGMEGHAPGHRWAMAIDLTVCTGCATCTIACVAENNISMVGKKEVTRGRAMHWIRVDRYYEVPEAKDKPEAEQDKLMAVPANVHAYFQPVPCQQCEKAPCELVCPVAATTHSADGLNDMVYNRCVGTRYCSNNCPYKVRRFNFLAYADYATSTLKLGRNPDVTVRSRGVMEKCTYCVQRIREAEIVAEREHATRETGPGGRPIIHDGEIVTACQAACPTQAIVFGDLNDPKSEVNNWKNEITNYGLMAELSTMPRTTYLASIRNPNPKMDEALKGGA